MTENEYKAMIYEKASKVKTTKDLTKLIEEITSFDHDYGTIVYGCMAAMTAAFNVVNDSPKGGITGFQAGCLGWECVHKFMMIEAPCRIVDLNHLLYPQYASKFEKIISQETWDDLQKKAKDNLAKNSEAEVKAHPNVIEHWKKCAAGEVPFGFQIGET